ncbi:hypothetical protein [sulfur-oxidizing endosymbiont of Gigantopelta aegis]|uniref:hypothetical protein n=1 Tax=sulfur-oxidizing endosymbiont of Gigantopelta aegis TaxID=2794934 RepID=UPI0018DB17DA|nr:hypothetical protein [sulfur-oxidizing endosymbiont of Gigantopelta aegis]
MDIYERDYIAAVINYFWGPNITTSQGVNKSAAVVAYKALEKANICSRSMDLVPRPMGLPSSTYAIKQLAKIGKRIMSGNSLIYHVCKVRVSANDKTDILMALRGI